MTDLLAGVYKHYKGGLYMVMGVARHSETEERLVAYVPLSVQPGPRITVRPYDMFFDTVTVNGRNLPRFTYMGEQVEEPVATWYDHMSGYRGADRVDD